jgi:hypothetical protein
MASSKLKTKLCVRLGLMPTPNRDSQLSVDAYIVTDEKEYRIWLKPEVRYSLSAFEQKDIYVAFLDECRALAKSMNIPVEFDKALVLAVDDIKAGDTEFKSCMQYIVSRWREQDKANEDKVVSERP